MIKRCKYCKKLSFGNCEIHNGKIVPMCGDCFLNDRESDECLKGDKNEL
jgi:hypothetical protein